MKNENEIKTKKPRKIRIDSLIDRQRQRKKERKETKKNENRKTETKKDLR